MNEQRVLVTAMEDIHFTNFDGIPLCDFDILCALHIKLQAADIFTTNPKSSLLPILNPMSNGVGLRSTHRPSHYQCCSRPERCPD